MTISQPPGHSMFCEPEPLTPEQITDIMDKSNGALTDLQCRTLVHYMMGYMHRATDIECARQAYFKQVKAATEGKAIPVWP